MTTASPAPQLAAFPKAFMDELCVTGEMSLSQWIRLAATLNVDGLELYSGMLDLRDASQWPGVRAEVEDAGLCVPMMCCSPDFTHPDAAFRAEQIAKEKQWIDMTAALGGSYCRVLSGQRRPEVSREQGIGFAAECIEACIPFAAERGVTLIIENHYKDNYWTYPEFAQHMDVFCELVERIAESDAAQKARTDAERAGDDAGGFGGFGVNYDPSNTILAGEDPLALLDRVKHRVVTMHASDRYLTHGTIEDLRQEENAEGYASRLSHGEIGKGLNDYDAIFATLKGVGFAGWISIEDGVEGMEQLARSVTFLRRKIAEHWG